MNKPIFNTTPDKNGVSSGFTISKDFEKLVTSNLGKISPDAIRKAQSEAKRIIRKREHTVKIVNESNRFNHIHGKKVRVYN